MRSIGLMSGTSMDGIDGVMIETDGIRVGPAVARFSLSYAPLFRKKLRQAEQAIRMDRGHLGKASVRAECAGFCLEDVIRDLTSFHAEVCSALEVQGGKADIIGFHGQTMYHAPKEGLSLQVGDAHLLANLTQTPVVSDFRSHDIREGGQGAPLAPFYHQALVISKGVFPLAIVNCGGIANITFVEGPAPDDVMAFDVGPGNVLLDQLMRERTRGIFLMDEDGQHGARGHVDKSLFHRLIQHTFRLQQRDFFNRSPPKSLDSRDFEDVSQLTAGVSLEDAAATLAFFTAWSVGQSLKWIESAPAQTWVLAGGGWRNPLITKALRIILQDAIGPQVRLMHADDYGWSSTYMEAELMAFLAVRSLYGMPLTTPRTTGVNKPVTGGCLSLPDQKNHVVVGTTGFEPVTP